MEETTTTIVTATKTKTIHTFSRKELLDALGLTDECEIADDYEVTVTVPGGGDWSNQDLDIDRDTPLVVTITTSGTIETADDGCVSTSKHTSPKYEEPGILERVAKDLYGTASELQSRRQGIRADALRDVADAISLAIGSEASAHENRWAHCWC